MKACARIGMLKLAQSNAILQFSNVELWRTNLLYFFHKSQFLVKNRYRGNITIPNNHAVHGSGINQTQLPHSNVSGDLRIQGYAGEKRGF